MGNMGGVQIVKKNTKNKAIEWRNKEIKATYWVSPSSTNEI